MLPPVETALHAGREAIRPVILTATTLALVTAAPLAAQAAADDVGTVIDPQGEPGDPQPDKPTVDNAADVDELLAVPDPNANLDTPPPPTGDDGIDAEGNREIAFEADILEYSSDNDMVTASGNVVLRSGDRSLRADSVSWSQRTGEIVASGRVRFVDENGNQLFSERIELTDEFEAGAMDNLLLALRQGGRLAANRGIRESDGTVALEKAAYSGCSVVDPEGCPRDPSWRITAERVIYSPDERRIRFSGAFLEIFGARVLPLPGLTVRTDGGAVSGFLVPDLRVSESNGVEVSGSYYIRFADNRDLTVTTHVYTDAAPMVAAQWRHLTERGAYQITGYATHSQRISSLTGVSTSEEEFRGYLFANGKFQLTPDWSLTGSIRRATDRTFLRRYDISRDDRLRSTLELERIGSNTYFSLAGWATQTLRLNQPQGEVPIALPVLDVRWRPDTPILGGQIELQANTLAIHRDVGQDTQRAFARAQWDLRRVTGLGQVVTFTGMLRGDVYHSDENFLTATASYRGNPGWEFRGVALGAVDVLWPFVGTAFGGTQVFTPRVQFVATPPIRNLAIPNEDARAIDLEDSNLFALNRFPGYDRVEDGARVTYGFDWALRIPNWELKTNIGQSYRLDSDRDILPVGTGLSERFSDFVGRTEVRYKDFLRFTHRFRLDKDSLAIRRNEIDATVGSRRTYAELGYVRLNRDITQVEDLQDREELRGAVRVAFANYWSLFGSGVFNLTDREEDPTFSSDGFDPIRTRLGVAYQDDCLELGVTWRRDYITSGDAERGDTFQVYFSLRNLGFR
ncbi:LPS assembly protein LptD [Erythrobacter sp.]|uniref:LPS-assembly protein LptD n=1 Tax=Erythrobacter sp. TaxID=1042 RepID=UPI001B038925|nr:LPS assembly protein LptD [Erythrobacter sp.]MBO6527879.1 LPS-assembly protein LptD [Erythrobacter sp.]MBO6528728.1 LPS-assembly protein LptD [Erythrobacter sp.]